jgi:DNA-binding transcriptional regulator YiaG
MENPAKSFDPYSSNTNREISQTLTIQGKLWITKSEFARRVGVSTTTVRYWIKVRCPILGKGLQSRIIEHPDPRSTHRNLTFLPASFADEIIEARNRCESQSRIIAGAEWITVNEFARRTKTSRCTVYTWTTDGCSILGRSLPTRTIVCRVSASRNMAVKCVPASLVELVIDAKSQLAEQVMYGGALYLSIDAAAKRARVSVNCIRRWCNHPCPRMGKKLTVHTVPSNGRWPMRFVAAKDCDSIARSNAIGGIETQSVDGVEWITVREFASRLGVSIAAVNIYLAKGCPFLNRPIPTRKFSKVYRGEHERLTTFLPASFVDRILSNIDRKEESIIRDGELYLSLNAAAKRANIPEARLRKWVRCECSLLKRKVMSFKRRFYLYPRRGSREQIMVRGSDCDAIAAALAVPDGWVELEEGAKQLDVHKDVLRRWCRKSHGCQYHPVGHVRSRVLLFPSMRGKLVPTKFVNSDDLKTVFEGRAIEVKNDLEIDGIRHLSTRRAAELCGVTISGIYGWHTVGCCWLGDKLPARFLPQSRKRSRGKRPELFFPFSELEKIVANRRNRFRPTLVGTLNLPTLAERAASAMERTAANTAEIAHTLRNGKQKGLLPNQAGTELASPAQFESDAIDTGNKSVLQSEQDRKDALTESKQDAEPPLNDLARQLLIAMSENGVLRDNPRTRPEIASLAGYPGQDCRRAFERLRGLKYIDSLAVPGGGTFLTEAGMDRGGKLA